MTSVPFRDYFMYCRPSAERIGHNAERRGLCI